MHVEPLEHRAASGAIPVTARALSAPGPHQRLRGSALAVMLLLTLPFPAGSAGLDIAAAQDMLLRQAEAALRENRLTTPARDNALDHFIRLLVLDPDHPRALAGMDEIALRYQQLATRAASNGDAPAAAKWLDLATQVAPAHPLLARSRDTVDRQLTAPILRLPLDEDALRQEDPELALYLTRLGTDAKRDGLFVIITSPVDAWSRWIYQQMATAPGAERIRARSELGAAASLEMRTLAN